MRKILCFFTLLLFSTQVDARWETIAEAESKTEFINRDIDVNADGTSVEIWEEQTQILNETGRSINESVRFYYNENSEELEILEAKSISAVDGKSHIVPQDMIEDKPIASVSGGFDQTRQIKVAFPNLRLKDRIYYKVKRTVKKILLPGYYDTGYVYGEFNPLEKSRISITSALPLFIEEFNADKALQVTQEKKLGKYHYVISLKKPVYKRANEHGILPAKLMTRVFLSSLKDNAELARRISQKYEKVLTQDLPKLYQDIAKKAAEQKTDIDKINMVTSSLAEKINYLGDWRTVEGQMVPRDFKKVVETGVGDCKDFSSATVAILRSIGFKANSALVMRAYIYLEPSTNLPYLNNYNHAILWAKNKEGRVFWLDPTNMTSMADGIYPDIEDRPSLVLDGKSPRLDKIPAIAPEHAAVKQEFVIEVTENAGIRSTGTYQVSGELANDYTGAMLRRSKREVEDAFISRLTGENTILDKKITLPDLTSRIVKPLTFGFSYKKENMLQSTTLGHAIPVRNNWANIFIYAPEDQVAARDLGTRQSHSNKMIIKGVKVSDLSRLNKEIDTPWVYAKRVTKQVGSDLVIQDDVTFKANFIFGEEVQTKMYKQLVADLKNYFVEIIIIDESGSI